MLLVSENDTQVCYNKQRGQKTPCHLELASNLILFISAPASRRQEIGGRCQENGLCLRGVPDHQL